MRLRPYHMICIGLIGLPGTPGADPLSFYGTSGLVDMPTAETLPDGSLALTSSKFGPTLRNSLTFQITPRLQGTFRYSQIEDYDLDGTKDRFDRSFDLSYQLWQETGATPAISIGIRDFGGTGTFSGEYVVASKHLMPTLNVTGGIGWGRLGSRNGFDNPLGTLDDGFLTRPASGTGDINTTGRLDYQTWFRGDAALFGGIQWAPNDDWTFTAEYSSDTYQREQRQGVFTPKSPINLGVSYAFDNGVDLGAYSLYGTDFGVRVSYVIDPETPPFAGGIDSAPPAIRPRSNVAAASWNQPGNSNARIEIVRRQLADQGQILTALDMHGSRADVRIVNSRFGANAQALGRTARILANTLPANVTTFDITLERSGQPLTTTRVQRTDLEDLEHALDGTWQSFARARISDAQARPEAVRIGPTQKLWTNLGYYIVPALFDPDSPVRVEYGAQFDASYAVRPDTFLSGRIRQEVGGNLSSATRNSNSVVERVRSDSFRYARESQTELTFLVGEHFFRPAPQMFGRVSAGYLEQMYGGVSTELLWYPVDSPLALGGEINYVRQRDFDGGLGFRDYQVLTGHASAYYDFGNGFTGQMDVGRYLAGDWGATWSLDRSFDNGFTVGAFMTLTDMPFEDFGEGSFDKGIRVVVPTSWLTGKATRSSVAQVIRPVLRDGGARLSVNNRLYGVTQDSRADAMADQWGRFWR